MWLIYSVHLIQLYKLHTVDISNTSHKIAKCAFNTLKGQCHEIFDPNFFLLTWLFSIPDRAGNLLVRASLIRSFPSNQMSDCERFAQIAQDKWATVSKLLRSLRGNERPWANRSGRSRQMSNHEQFAQVAQRKWAIHSTKFWLKISKILILVCFIYDY